MTNDANLGRCPQFLYVISNADANNSGNHIVRVLILVYDSSGPRKVVMAQVELSLDNMGKHILIEVSQIGDQKWFRESRYDVGFLGYLVKDKMGESKHKGLFLKGFLTHLRLKYSLDTHQIINYPNFLNNVLFAWLSRNLCHNLMIY